MFSKIVLNKINQISVLLTLCEFIYSKIESTRIKVSEMHLETFIHNQHNHRLYRDHVNMIDYQRMAEIIIYNIQLHLRNTDF